MDHKNILKILELITKDKIIKSPIGMFIESVYALCNEKGHCWYVMHISTDYKPGFKI